MGSKFKKSGMKILVGNTGFVGSNLCLNTYFDGLYNSKNIRVASLCATLI